MDQEVRENILVLWLKVGEFPQNRAASRNTVGKKQVGEQHENCLNLTQQGNLENNTQFPLSFRRSSAQFCYHGRCLKLTSGNT